MSIPYEATGRANQKARTRQALVEAARRLLAEGHTPQVEDAAEAAGISRTTAYRYFANQRTLLQAAHPDISPMTLLGPDAPAALPARLDAFVEAFCDYNFTWQHQLRAALRLALEPGAARPTLRQGRAVAWVEDALQPLARTHPQVDIHELAVAIRSATGIETLIWLTDIAGYDRAQATRTVHQTARALLSAAMSQPR
ncbi:TetR/AcrR family transcriptional regulator [Catellatospora sp. TT07R-123]|uniref:TetR/AcrR family transcriptional regulator n=1 Tax=Catellatospora sp. TT07R-123 TaxID=2733863 RepID=UPI001BB41934|nr:TetR/AcrR family transcriptional regulator [Catellatospora sp. TT07R-123]